MTTELLDYISPAYKGLIDFSKWEWKKKVPLKIELHPEQLCNLGCAFCINDEYRNETSNFERLNVNSYLVFLKKAYRLGSQIVSISGGGEPMLYRSFYDLLRESKKIGFYTKVATNGTLFKSKDLNRILDSIDHLRISLNALSRESYIAEMRKDKFDIVLKNLQEVINYKAQYRLALFIEVSFQLTNNNVEAVIQNLPNFLKSYSVDKINIEVPYEVSSKSIEKVLLTKNINRLTKLISENSKISSNLTDFLHKGKCFSNCIVPYFKVTVNNDGRIHPCCQLSDRGGEFYPQYILGNIEDENIFEKLEEADKLISTINPQKCPQCIPSKFKLNHNYSNFPKIGS